MITQSRLISKYDVPAPRYTSYPTVPYWETNPTSEQWLQCVERSMQPEDSSLAIYIHVPFCETLCSFCGCNTSITRNHDVELPYIQDVLNELRMYQERVPATGERALRELHLGGGSPTYLSPDSMQRLLEPMLESCRVSADVELSIEVDPRRTTLDQLKVLAGLGFRRISLGVQDFDPEVQRLINRNQDYECTRRVTEQARELGYHSINYDLIYGLPRQDERTMRDTIEKTIALRPDRLAFYSYAHVPWIKAAQRLFTEADLPSGEEKRNLYELGRDMFASADYQEIGMDHFALRTDGLWKAVEAGTLHRNFMGYTTQNTNLMLGLGVSSISDSWDCFHQNEKVTKKYQKLIGEGQFPTFRGHMLSPEDLRVRRLILDVATTWRVELPADILADVRAYLSEMEADKLIVFEGNQMRVTDVGRPFLRNICMGLDLRFRRNKPDTKVFSQSI